MTDITKSSDMDQDVTIYDELPDAPPRQKLKLSWSGKLGVAIVAFWVLMVFIGPYVAPFHEADIIADDSYLNPGYVTEGEGTHWLGTDYLDLYQIHKPDPDRPIEETLEAMDSLVREGKVRYIGCSNYSGAQVDEARAASAKGGFAPFVTAQNRYSLLNREVEAEVLPACRAHGVGFIPFFPLESGLLTGKYRRGAAAPEDSRLGDERFAGRFLKDESFDVVERLETFALARGHTILDLAMSWLVSKPEVVCVIAGATKPGQIDQNLAAAQWALSADEFAQVDRLTRSPQPA